jgi:hypothetical protein
VGSSNSMPSRSAVAFILAALGSIVIVPMILAFVDLSDFGDVLLRIGRWPAMYLVLRARRDISGRP